MVTFGAKYGGGNSTQVQDKLQNVETIHSTKHAFAAKLTNNTVVVWGDVYDGARNHSRVDGQHVKLICANCGAFAAILMNGSVISWGSSVAGGDMSKKVTIGN